MNKIKALALFLAAILVSGNVSGTQRTLLSAYQELIESTLGSEMIFFCGQTTFKAVSGFMSSPKLYWKDGLNWSQLESAIFKDNGIEHTDLGSRGGIPLADLYINIDLPIYREGIHSPLNQDDQRDIKRYVRKLENDNFNDFLQQIDMISASRRSTNISNIEDFIEFDTERYIEEQSQPDVIFSLGRNYEAEQEKKRLSMARTLQKATSGIKNPIQIITHAREYSRTDYCRLLQ